MQFSIRLLIFLMLCGALVANAIQHGKLREKYAEEIPLLVEASKARRARRAENRFFDQRDELRFFDQRADFHRRFFEQREVRKVEAEEALARFHQMAARNSRIEPDDSGKMFLRRIPQLEDDDYGVRVWVPEKAKLQLMVGFIDNQRGKPSGKRSSGQQSTFCLPKSGKSHCLILSRESNGVGIGSEQTRRKLRNSLSTSTTRLESFDTS